MLILSRTYGFVLLILVSVVSGFAATGAVTAAWLWLWLGTVVWLVIGKPIWSRSVLPNLMLTFLLWISVSVWWSHFPYSSWYAVQIFSAIPIVFIAWQLTPKPDEVWGHLKKGFLVGAWIFSILGIYQVSFLGLPRALGPVSDPNVYACLLNLAWFPLLAAFFKSDSGTTKKSRLTQLILGLSLSLVGLAFFAASSRGAIFTWLLLMPLALLAFRHLPKFHKNVFISLSIALASYFIAILITNTDFSGRASVEYMAQDASVSLRLLMWRNTVDMFAANPYLGSGLGTWSSLYPAYRQAEDNNTAGIYAHNDYLQIAQEGGVITFIIFILIFISLALLFVRTALAEKQQPIQIENVGLMLGVMAAYLHASVNFIFYLIYLNIIVGLYAARAWQSSSDPRRICFTWPNALGSTLRRVLVLFILAIPITQIMLHEVSEISLNGHSRLLALLRKQFPQLTPYGIAWFIAAVRPNEYIAQRYIVDSAAQSLREIDPLNLSLKQEILSETIKRYDELRLYSANAAELGAIEANLILEYRDLMSGDSAVRLARSVARSALKINPRHVDSIIALAKSYFLEGDQAAGYEVLSDGISNMVFLRDRLILQAELLKYLIPSVGALNEIQNGLKNIKLACKIGDCYENQVMEEKLQAQLYTLAAPIMPTTDSLVKNSLK